MRVDQGKMSRQILILRSLCPPWCWMIWRSVSEGIWCIHWMTRVSSPNGLLILEAYFLMRTAGFALLLAAQGLEVAKKTSEIAIPPGQSILIAEKQVKSYWNFVMHCFQSAQYCCPICPLSNSKAIKNVWPFRVGFDKRMKFMSEARQICENHKRRPPCIIAQHTFHKNQSHSRQIFVADQVVPASTNLGRQYSGLAYKIVWMFSTQLLLLSTTWLGYLIWEEDVEKVKRSGCNAISRVGT